MTSDASNPRPQPLSPLRQRPPASKNVPPAPETRDRILLACRRLVAQEHLLPPLGLEELKERTAALLEAEGLSARYMDFALVVLNNESWRDTLAGIPCNKRLLLLPQCLRDNASCPAAIDEFGLLCEGCGRCTIHDFLTQARELGYVTMVAEGSAVVTAMIASGQVEAVVGVSCLDMLAKVFPYMEAAAVPGIALPLLYDGCVDTTLDLDWLWESIALSRETPRRRLDLDALRAEVDCWFTPPALAELLGEPATETQQAAHDWLAAAGKRWRPVLTAATVQALVGDEADPAAVATAAVAVECFHKASLIHDDIEDDDPVRYGKPALHEALGLPVALNVGDYLLGEGYRLLSRATADPARTASMMRVAAEGHHELCLGQGEELTWARNPRPLSVRDVLDIFRRKTSPAFEVALRVGAALAGQEEQLRDALHRYSVAVGIAYQIRDDLDDGCTTSPDGDLSAMRPSVLPAIALQRANADDAELLRRVWTRRASDDDRRRLEEVLTRLDVRPIARGMLEFHKARAIRALIPLRSVELKALLRRLVAKIFGDVETMGCCDEHSS